MPRRSRGLMSDALKWDLARELGVADIVESEGWGGVSARNCGNLVKLAVARAEAALARQQGQVYTRPGFEAAPGPASGETRGLEPPRTWT